MTNFLLCQESFQRPEQDFFLRLTQASVLPFYFLVLGVCLLSTLHTIYRRLRWEACSTQCREIITLVLLGHVQNDNPGFLQLPLERRQEVAFCTPTTATYFKLCQLSWLIYWMLCCNVHTLTVWLLFKLGKWFIFFVLWMTFYMKKN